MIRALIVDDEKMTRNGLLRHIKWEQLGVDEVQTAASSNEALQLLGYAASGPGNFGYPHAGHERGGIVPGNPAALAPLPDYFFDRLFRQRILKSRH